jgi:hypothetical protein
VVVSYPEVRNPEPWDFNIVEARLRCHIQEKTVSLYVNNAAIESWRELEKTIDPPLQAMMSRNGENNDVVSAWVSEMLQNSVDAYADVERSPDTQPKRIRRSID